MKVITAKVDQGLNDVRRLTCCDPPRTTDADLGRTPLSSRAENVHRPRPRRLWRSVRPCNRQRENARVPCTTDACCSLAATSERPASSSLLPSLTPFATADLPRLARPSDLQTRPRTRRFITRQFFLASSAKMAASTHASRRTLCRGPALIIPSFSKPALASQADRWPLNFLLQSAHLKAGRRGMVTVRGLERRGSVPLLRTEKKVGPVALAAAASPVSPAGSRERACRYRPPPVRPPLRLLPPLLSSPLFYVPETLPCCGAGTCATCGRPAVSS